MQPFFSGISLDVTPQIDEDGMVMLHIRPSVSVVSERTRVVNLGNLGSFTLPLASSNINEADSVVRVMDGVTPEGPATLRRCRIDSVACNQPAAAGCPAASVGADYVQASASVLVER